MKENKIPVKNYFILAFIFLIGIGLTIYFCKWYEVIDTEKKQTPVIRGVIPEISSQELDNFVLENPTTVLYLCTSDNMKCRNFEKDFKKYIIKESMENYIVYVNLTNINQVKFVKDFNNNYEYKTKLTPNYPALIYFNDGKISDMIEGTNSNKLTLSKAKDIIRKNKIGD